MAESAGSGHVIDCVNYMGASEETIAAVRSFSRFYTAWVGALGGGHVGSEHSLTDARVLYELGRVDQMATADLERLLQIDRGQLSRTVRRLAEAGLVDRLVVEEDGRRRDLALTSDGRATAKDLDCRSEQQVRDGLVGLSPAECERLCRALGEVTGLLDRVRVAT